MLVVTVTVLYKFNPKNSFFVAVIVRNYPKYYMLRLHALIIVIIDLVSIMFQLLFCTIWFDDGE